MNILILTPIDPISITIIARNLFSSYCDHNDLFSIQMLALLDGKEDKFLVNNNYFAAEMRDNPRVALSKIQHYDNLIVFGNCDNKTIKFDHIITWAQIWDNTNEDKYLIKQQELVEPVFRAHRIKPIRWYKFEDAHYCFPTWEHLCLFLKTQGVQTNDIQ